MSSRVPGFGKLVQWRIECLAHSVLDRMCGVLPGPWVFRLGEWLGALAWYLLPARRRTVVRNLRIAFAGEKTPEEIRSLARASFRRTGANLVSAAHTAHIPLDRLGEVFELSNPEALHQALAPGRGLVLLLSHMGNWELLSRIVHFFPQGVATGAFYRPLNNPLLDQQVLDRRQADGTRMFSKHDNPLQVATFVRQGGAVGILADQRTGPRGEPAVFFGRATRVSPLPALLARRAKCPVVALSMTTTAPGKWRATVIPVSEPPQTRHCMDALETAMQASPVDVFWFQERWKTYVRPDYPLADWLDAPGGRSAKPSRLVFWLLDAPPGWQPDPGWLHPDATIEVLKRKNTDQPVWISPSVQVDVLDLPSHPSIRCLRRCLRALDGRGPLPVDALIAPAPVTPGLAKAARREGIRLVEIPFGA